MFGRKIRKRMLERVKGLSDEEILERERELYARSVVSVLIGAVIFVFCVVGIVFLIPYL